MAVWRDKTFLYKISFLGVIIGSLLFVVGFCVPAWATFNLPLLDASSSKRVMTLGLWQQCVGDMSLCKSAIDNNNPGWLKAVRALESVSMFFTVVACIIGFYFNCALKAQLSSGLFNKNVETSAIVSVVFGSFGMIIFATQVERYYDYHIGRISWGFVLVCVSHTIMGVSAFLMLISRRVMLNSARQILIERHLGAASSHPSTVNLPSYMQSEIIMAGDPQLAMGPPAYETVVNCIPPEPAPPPYEQVAKVQG